MLDLESTYIGARQTPDSPTVNCAAEGHDWSAIDCSGAGGLENFSRRRPVAARRTE